MASSQLQINLHYSVEHKDFEYEKKDHYPKKGVMPCAKSKAGTKR